jgi:hypothetical protein
MKAIGRELRLMYADIISQGVPDYFAAILRRLDDPNDEGSTPLAAPSAPQQANRDDGNGSELLRRRDLRFGLLPMHGLVAAPGRVLS